MLPGCGNNIFHREELIIIIKNYWLPLTSLVFNVLYLSMTKNLFLFYHGFAFYQRFKCSYGFTLLLGWNKC